MNIHFLILIVAFLGSSKAKERVRGGIAARRLYPKEACLLVQRDILFEEGYIPEIQPRRWQCMLSQQDVRQSHMLIVDLDGIDDDELDLDENVQSGVTTLLVEGSEIIPLEGKIVIPQSGNRNLRQRSTMERKRRVLSNNFPTVSSVLAIRVIATDANTTSTAEEMRNDIFYDDVNLRTQYNKCSYGWTRMEPFDGVTATTGYDVDRGVVEVEIDSAVSPFSILFLIQFVLENIILDQAEALLGNLQSQFDHVMICLPPGTGNWVAYAYVNHWLSVYNDDACNYPIVQMHEIGHNLNLEHSSRGNDVYGDRTCVMGYSYRQDDQRMCFNPSKSWQLGWYRDRRIELDFFTSQPTVPFYARLVGIANYDDAINDNEYVTVKVHNPDGIDVFVGFNRKTGVNDDVPEAADDVTVHTKDGEGSVVSYLVFNSTSGSYTYRNFGSSNEDLIVQVNGVDSSGSVWKADVIVYLTNCPPGGASGCSNSPSSRPSAPPSEYSITTVSPSANPSSAPTTLNPSVGPTFDPSSSPTINPSVGPTFDPSSSPTTKPSGVPTLDPSSSPTPLPSANPSLIPSSMPSISATLPWMLVFLEDFENDIKSTIFQNKMKVKDVGSHTDAVVSLSPSASPTNDVGNSTRTRKRSKKENSPEKPMNQALQLKDNDKPKHSIATTYPIHITSHQMRLEFYYQTVNFESGDFFVVEYAVQTAAGSPVIWEVLFTYMFENETMNANVEEGQVGMGLWVHEMIEWNNDNPGDVIVQFRCNSANKQRKVYIDDIMLLARD